MPSRYTSSADTHAMIARIAPSVLELLGDGVLRSRKAIVAALAGQHEKDEVVRTLMRLAVIGQIVDIDRKYGLPVAAEHGQGCTLRTQRKRSGFCSSALPRRA